MTMRAALKMTLLHLAMLLIVAIGTTVSVAADPYINGTFNFKHLLTLQQGEIGPGRITAIAEDHQGFIWVGGDNGLARYDGHQFLMFNYDSVDANSLSANGVVAIEVDSAGTVWVLTVGAINGGLNRYDPEHEKFIRYDNLRDHGNSIEIIAMDSDSDNRIYLLTEKGIAVITRDTPLSAAIQFDHRFDRAVAINPDFIFVDRLDRIWMASKTNGVAVMDSKGSNFHHWSENSANDLIRANTINRLFQDSLGNIWVATNHGALRVKEDFSSSTPFNHIGATQSVASAAIATIAEDNNRKIWLATEKSGIHIFHPQTELFTQLRNNRQDPKSIASNTILNIFRDRAKDLWLAVDPLGMDYLDMDSLEVIRKVNDPANDRSLSNDGILRIISDRQGSLWIGTEDGLNQYDKNTRQFKTYVMDKAIVAPDRGLKSATIISLAADLDGDIWVGTYGGGLHKLNPQTGVFKHYQEGQGPGRFVGSNVWSLLRDSNNTIWASSVAGIARYDRATDSFTYFKTTVDGAPIVDFPSIYESKPNTLLVGTFWGFYEMNTRTEKIVRIGANNSLFKSQLVLSIARATDGEIWLGTRNGIVILDKNNQIVGRLGIEEGLPDNSIPGLLKARDGKVWATTGYGVAVIDPKTKSIKALNRHHGLAGDIHKHSALFEDINGDIYIGGTGGLSILPQQDLEHHQQSPRVKLLSLSILNKRIIPDQESSPLRLSITQTEMVELNHRQNMFALEFSAINPKLAEHLKYEYRLAGLSDQWIVAGKNRTAAFTNLAPGHYQFSVRARPLNSALDDNLSASQAGLIGPDASPRTRYTTLEINVKPAPWLSLSAKLSYLFVLGLAIYFVYIARHLHQKKIEAEKAVDVKSDFFAKLSQEIRMPLTGVLGLLDDICGNSAVPRSVREKLKTAQVSAIGLFEATMDILDLAKLEAGQLEMERKEFDLAAAIKSVVDAAVPAAKHKSLVMVLTLAPNLPQTAIGDPTRINQALRKLLDNAIKFTEQGSIHIYVKALLARAPQANSIMIQFSVEDTGIGISENNLKLLFRKFSQVDIRNRQNYGGTGLGLSLCKRLVTLMGGDVNVESHPGAGTVIHFTIPLGLPIDQHQAEELKLTKHFPPAVEQKEALLSSSSDPLQKKLFTAFTDTLPERLDELKCARMDSDFETLARIYHGIKGGAAHLGDESLASTCFALERASDDRNLDLVDSLHVKFLESLTAYIHAMIPPAEEKL